MTALATVAHVNRFKTIVLTLLKYGFDDVAERLELPGQPLLKRVIQVEKNLTGPQRLRRCLEELGPTFVKLGQVMSLRSELLPAAYVEELRGLHDEVAPVESSAIREQIESQLGRSIEEVFVEFDDVPLAAASLAQVHRGVLRDDRQVVAVKAQRPGIEPDVESDIAIMEMIARQLDQRMEAAAVYDLPGLVDEFDKTLHRELDYTHEARHMRIFRANFAADPEVQVPAVFDEYSTERLLVMELVEGVRVGDVPPDQARLRRELARRGLRVFVKQVLEDGFFHADPHPGNIVVRSDGTLFLLDCGMVGRLTDTTRFELTDLIQAGLTGDSERLVEVLVDLAGRPDGGQSETLEHDALDLIDAYQHMPLRQIDLGRFLSEIAELLRANHLSLPRDLSVMLKALITAEGVARQLDPELNVVEEIAPLVSKLVAERWQPQRLRRRLQRSLGQLLALQRRLPQQLAHIVDKLERGRLALAFRHENLDPLQRTIEDSASRLTVAIIVGAIVIGSSLVISAGIGPRLFDLPILGLGGYVVSALLGLWIVFNIVRSHRW
jgi:ubiquinone biosynthesis protein